MEGWLSPVIQAKPAIALCFSLGFDTYTLKDIQIHFTQLLTNAVRKLWHTNRACCTAQVASANDVYPELKSRLR